MSKAWLTMVQVLYPIFQSWYDIDQLINVRLFSCSSKNMQRKLSPQMAPGKGPHCLPITQKFGKSDERSCYAGWLLQSRSSLTDDIGNGLKSFRKHSTPIDTPIGRSLLHRIYSVELFLSW